MSGKTRSTTVPLQKRPPKDPEQDDGVAAGQPGCRALGARRYTPMIWISMLRDRGPSSSANKMD
jgi:hypothetical protein